MGDGALGVGGGDGGRQGDPAGPLRVDHQLHFGPGGPERRVVGQNRHQLLPLERSFQRGCKGFGQGVEKVGPQGIADVDIEADHRQVKTGQPDQGQSPQPAAPAFHRNQKGPGLGLQVGAPFLKPLFGAGRTAFQKDLGAHNRGGGSGGKTSGTRSRRRGGAGGGDDRRLLGGHRNFVADAVDHQTRSHAKRNGQPADGVLDQKIGQIEVGAAVVKKPCLGRGGPRGFNPPGPAFGGGTLS